MELSEARGKLIAIGGGEDREGERRILKEFVKLSKGPKARLVVLTIATNSPAEVGAEYKSIFRQLGVDEVEVVDVSQRTDTEKESALKAIGQATGLFFTGGDQLHITSLLGGTVMHKLIHERYEKGVVIGGTSAGAAMMSNSMIIGGEAESNPRMEGVELGPGMDLIVGVMIDTHFSQRGRFGRLLTAVAHYPQDLGLGLDENTAMVVHKDTFEVIGEGSVIVVDGSSTSYTNLPYVDKQEGVALYDVHVHVLTEGHKFDLTHRRPIIEESATKKRRGSNSNASRRPRRK